MRNPFSAIVNWVAALFAAGSGAPHPIVATDPPRTSRTSQTSRKPRKPQTSRKPKRRRR